LNTSTSFQGHFLNMGCDGGTIPTRDELVRTKKKPEQKDKDSARMFKWQHCHLTQQKLTKPIVACELGFLYSKEVIIEKLLDSKGNKDSSTSKNDIGSHIKSLKDVRELELTDNPAFRHDRKKDLIVGDGGYNDKFKSPYVCPIAGLEMNGKFKFVIDWNKGKVLSERGHKIVMKTDPEMRIAPENLIVLNAEEREENDAMLANMEARRARAKAQKAAKKAAKRGSETPRSTDGPSSSKSSKMEAPDSSVKTANGKPSSALQKDPSKSEVYKSLFSSHKSAANKPKGNWVTYDPRYN